MLEDRDALLTAAMTLPRGRRSSFLDEACGTDARLRHELDRLLREFDDEDPFLRPGGALTGPFGDDLLQALHRDAGIPLGTTVGPYRVVGELGRGGMAVVYLAERADGAFTQRVALKVVKRGTDTDEVITRFRQERQILASLTHPNIARLLDGGVTPDGRPFLAMELVQGEPIDEYCALHDLDVDACVDLCIAVTRAVEHAHRRLVVHRDLKPSNILIGDDGAIKLLDFGIAKLLDPSSVDHAAPPTMASVRVMTPQYASPEQVRGDVITTASDVYQLGLILFELLTGQRAHQLTDFDASEAARVVCEQPTPRPSSVVRAAGARDVRARHLRGDLDNIVLTALAKEPERRYATVHQFAEDLVRYRQGLPVMARGRSWRYRSAKFLKRNAVAVGAAACALVVLGAIVAFYSLRLASERTRAQREAATATEVAEFMSGLFRASDPMQGGGANLTAREILARGAARIDSDLAGQPDVRARLMHVVGNIYRSLGLNDDAIPLLERALEGRLADLGAAHVDVAQSRQSLGLALYNAGRLAESRPQLEEALRVQEALLGPIHADLAATLNTIGLLNRREGRLTEARDALQRALSIRERALGPEHADLATVLNNLALTNQTLGDLAQARALFERALAIHERHRGPDHPFVSGTLSNLGNLTRQMGDAAAARLLLERALAVNEKAYGPDHQTIATDANALGMAMMNLGLDDEARAQFERSLAVYTAALGPAHGYLAFPLTNLGHLAHNTGDSRGALAFHERALAIRTAAYGSVHRDVALSLERVGAMRAAVAGCAAAVPVLEQAVDVIRRTWPADDELLAAGSAQLGACLTEAGRFEHAEQLLLDARRIFLARAKPAGGDADAVARDLTRLYEAWGRPDDVARYRVLNDELGSTSADHASTVGATSSRRPR